MNVIARKENLAFERWVWYNIDMEGSDFAQTDPDKMNYDVLAKTTRYFKENEEGVSDMCRVMEEKFQDGVKLGIQQGLQEGKLESVLSVMKKFKLNFEQALDAVGVPQSEYGKYKELIKTANA